MIDPDQMIMASINDATEVTIDVVPESDYIIWDFDDEKQLKKYFKAVERMARNSFELKEFIQYIKVNFGMDQCAFIKSAKGTEFKVEQHHYPFTLYDIVEIVFHKREYYGELLDEEMVAKEVVMLHYKLIIGLIPLSKTAHQLHHDGKLFIPVDKVLGRYNLFVDMYKPFMSTDQLDILDRIEHYSDEYSDISSTHVLDTKHISISVNDNRFKGPNYNQLQTNMVNRIMDIKNNNYMLPTIDEINNGVQHDSFEDRKVEAPKELQKKVITPFHFVQK